MTIGLIGASGFIGLRLLELCQAKGLAIRAIVRHPSSLAVIARHPVDWRIADILDPKQLANALHGCDICVHAAIGDATQIVKMAQAACHASAQSGIKRLIWLSSASVHGQNPSPGIDESSPLHDHLPLVYNNAKVRAEWAIDKLSHQLQIHVSKLRPSVVYGPRSRWITDAAKDLRSGRAAWLSNGSAYCNAISVDNIMSAIEQCIRADIAGSHAYLIRDAETVTWRTFLLAIANHLGFDESAFSEAQPPEYPDERESRWGAFTLSPQYQQVGTLIPYRLKRLVKSAAKAWPAPTSNETNWKISTPSQTILTHEMTLLQQCIWNMPIAHAHSAINYQPPVSFEQGMRDSLQWLDRSGWGRRSHHFSSLPS